MFCIQFLEQILYLIKYLYPIKILQQLQNMLKISSPFLAIITLLLLLGQTSGQLTCHYTCKTCFGMQYYQCLTCQNNRGNSPGFTPIGGMCYCTLQSDQDTNGICSLTTQFNHNNKAVIAAFIALALFFTVVGSLITGYRHFLLKTIEDVQQISIIVFINLYFPQQFDIFLTNLYRFNISSFTFQAIAKGSLFHLNNDQIISSTDGQNIFGKYKLLYKTANFFANQFTWMIVFVCFVVGAIILRFVRNKLKLCQKEQKNKNKNQKLAQTSMDNKNQFFETKNQLTQGNQTTLKSSEEQDRTSCIYRWVNKVYNFAWLNFFIIFFYLSLIEININVFTQIGNLTFSSGFAATGAFFSALFLAIEFVVLGLLALKIREQTIKPEWMRDYTYTATIYLVRTNYKTITKYFWFFACIKKILLALMITTLYHSPGEAIIGISSVEIIFICFAVYCEPFERRYIRIHYYATEGMKLFLYVCLINFTEQYVEYARMIELTKILYFMLAFFFGFNFFFILLNLVAERDMYIRAWINRFYPNSDSKYKDGRLGYHSEGKLFIYERQ